MENVAYRGFSSVTPENTLTAFRRASEAGCHRISAELRVSEDGRPFCFADPPLLRMTGTHGWLHRMSSEEIRRRPVIFRGNALRVERIPTMDEWLRMAEATERALLLQVPCGTSPRWTSFVGPVADAVMEGLAPWRGRVDLLLASEDSRMLGRLREQGDWPVGAVVDRFAEGLRRLEDEGIAFLLVDRSLFIAPRRRSRGERFQQGGLDLMDACGARRRACYLGPVQKRAELPLLAALGPTGLLTPHTAQLSALGHRRKP